MAILKNFSAKRLLTGLTALSLMASVATFPAYADDSVPTNAIENAPAGEETTNVDDEPGLNYLSVQIEFANTSATADLSKVCYPTRPYLYDAEVKLTANGKVYEGKLVKPDSENTSSREYVFPGLTTPPQTSTLSISTDISAFVYLDDVDQYQYKIADSAANDVPDTTSITLTKDSWVDIKVPSNPRDEKSELMVADTKAYIDATAEDYGLCSVLVVDNLWTTETSSWVFKNREKYVPDTLTGATATVSGTVTSHDQPFGGLVYFRVPTKWNASKREYTKRANVNLELVGVDGKAYNTPFTAYLDISVPDNGVSAELSYYNLRASNFAYMEENRSEAGDIPTGGVITMPEEDLGTNFQFNIESILDKYNIDLSSADLDLSVLGKITDEYLAMFGSGDLGEQGTWGTLRANENGTQAVTVAAGKYDISGSDQLKLEYKGNLSIKDKATNEVTVKVAPKYTLELTSKSKTINCTINGVEYDGETKINFMLDGNKTYDIVDEDTGLEYALVATDEKPNLALTLGSTTGAIRPTTPSDPTPGGDDVPNTADNGITWTGWVFLGGIVLFLGSIGVLIWKTKKD